MATKTANVTARIQPDIKESAEAILERLGIDRRFNLMYNAKLLRRQSVLMEKVSPKVSIHSTLITTFGLVDNEYSGVFVNTITMNDLFR